MLFSSLSIRTRLSVVYTFVYTIMFMGLLIILISAPSLLQQRDIDAALQQNATKLLNDAKVTHDGDVPTIDLGEDLQEHNTFEWATIFFQIIDSKLRIHQSSPNLLGFNGYLDPDGIKDTHKYSTRTVLNGNQTMRVLTLPLTQGNGQLQGEFFGYLQIAQPIAPPYNSERIIYIVVALGLSTITLSWFVASMFSPKIFAPLDNISAVARELTITEDLSWRVPGADRSDEIGDLAKAINKTLERFENVFRTQRRFLADISHELRTPLTTIRGNVEVMQHMGQGDPEFLDGIISELERMTRLVRDLMLLARADVNGLPIERKPVDLDSLLFDVYRKAKQYPRDINIAIQDIHPARVLGDTGRLEQLLWNLVENAIKYTPDGGSITLNLTANEKKAKLSVSDTGIGIPEMDLPHIFERFYRVDKARTRAQGGSGLGLSICQWIARAHGGWINVTSAVDEGSTFTVTLPILREQTFEQPQEEPEITSSRTTRRIIRRRAPQQ